MPVIPSNAILRGYTYRMGPEHLKTQGLFFSFLKSLHITITYKAPTLTGVTCVVMLKSLKLSERNGLFCSCKWFRSHRGFYSRHTLSSWRFQEWSTAAWIPGQVAVSWSLLPTFHAEALRLPTGPDLDSSPLDMWMVLYMNNENSCFLFFIFYKI